MDPNSNLWDDVIVLRKKYDKKTDMNALKRSGKVETKKKETYTKNPNSLNNRVLDDTNEGNRHNKVELSLSKIIMKARLAKKLSQKQLAEKINKKPSVVIEYERGTAIPDHKVLGLMERELKVKLRGKKNLLGTPL